MILGFIATPLWSHMEPYTSIHNFLLCRRSFSHTTVSPPWQVRAIDPSRGGLSGAKPAGLKSKSLPYLPLDPLDPASCEASPLDLALLAWASCCWELRSDQLHQWSSAESMNDMNITEPFNKSTFQHVIGMWILWMWQEKVRENQLQFAQVGTTAPTAAVAALTMARPLRCRLGMWGVCVYHTITATYGPNILQVPKFRRPKICLSWGYLCCSVYTYEGSVYCTKCKFSCRV